MARKPLPKTLLPASEIEKQWHIAPKTLQRRAADGTIAPKTLQRRAADGTITAYRFGHRIVRYDPEEIMAKLCTTSRSWEVA